MKSIPSRVLMLCAAAGIVVLFSIVLVGNDGSGDPGSSLPFTGLAGTALLAGSYLWARGRVSNKGTPVENRLVCVEKIRLAPGKMLHLVETGNESLLVASAENGIRLIAKLEHPMREGDSGNPGERS